MGKKNSKDEEKGQVNTDENGKQKKRKREEKQQPKKQPKQTLRKLPVMYTNADSLKNKFTEFQVRVQLLKPKIIAVNEVKPKHSKYVPTHAEFNLDDVYDYDITPLNISNNVGRGMLLYTCKDLDAKEVTMDTTFSENIFVKVKLTSEDTLLIGLIYRSDSGADENNVKLRKLISEATAKGFSHILIMGDFNYSSVDWNTWRTKGDSTTSEEYLFIDNLQENCLFQHIDKPTRWRGTDEPHILDLVLTNEDTMVNEVFYDSPLGKSDHCVLHFDYVCYAEMEARRKLKRYYNKADYVKINQAISNINWDEEFGCLSDINTMWSMFQSKIASIEDQFIPKKIVTISSKQKSRIPLDSSTFAQIRRKNTLSRRYLLTKDPTVRQEYNRIRNKVKSSMRKLRKKFEKNLAKEAKQNPKAVWRYINAQSKTRKGIGELHVDPTDENSGVTDCDREKAEILAEFFTSVFTREPDGEVPSLPERNVKYPMKWLTVTRAIEKCLKELKVNKSPGPDGLTPYFLKHSASSISVPLCIIFNSSLQLQDVPQDWKRARISAIFKNKGSRRQAGNYRPVSLTSLVCKLLESLIREHITEFMKDNNLFTYRQYGFLQGRSISLQLLEVMDKWTDALDAGLSIDTIYMDYQKAFDTVPHKRLISKLKSYGFNQQITNWVKSFLTSRIQQVVVNGKKSWWMNVTSGIPQGSVLGPVLFVLFINDLPETVSSEVFLFADDTKIFKVIKGNEDQKRLREDLNALNEWSEKWLLKFHPGKCKHMHVGKSVPDSVTYSLNSTNLQSITQEKDIGVIIDADLEFESHISEKVKKASQMFALLRRSFNFLNDELFLPLYKSLVRVHLDFASSVWAPYKIKHVEQLESVQRRITRQLPGMKDLSYPERLRRLKLPTLSYRRLRGDLIEVYKITNGLYEKECTSCLKLWSDVTTTDGQLRGHTKKLFLQRSRLNIRENSFGVRVVPVWNKLSEDIVSAPDVDTFKNKLDELMLNQDIYYDDFKSKVTL